MVILSTFASQLTVCWDARGTDWLKDQKMSSRQGQFSIQKLQKAPTFCFVIAFVFHDTL